MRAGTLGLAALAALLPASAHADVTDDGMAPKGAFALALEAKFATAREAATRLTLSVKPELAYGAGESLEATLGFPRERGEGAGLAAGLKWMPIRREDWFAGAQAERAWTSNATHASSELKGIVGVRRASWMLAMNPVFAWPAGQGSRPDLSVAARLAREFAHQVTLGLEYHSGWRAQANSITGTVGFALRGFDIQLELGRGVTRAADRTSGRISVGRAM